MNSGSRTTSSTTTRTGSSRQSWRRGTVVIIEGGGGGVNDGHSVYLGLGAAVHPFVGGAVFGRGLVSFAPGWKEEREGEEEGNSLRPEPLLPLALALLLVLTRAVDTHYYFAGEGVLDA